MLIDNHCVTTFRASTKNNFHFLLPCQIIFVTLQREISGLWVML